MSTIELALVLPVFLTLILVGIQLSMIAVQYYNITHVARATARWTAIRPDTVDSDIVSHALSYSLPGVGSTGISSVSVAPSCPVLVSGRCTNRPSGENITLTITPRVAQMIFLPTTFRLGTIQLNIPTSLPGYTVAQVIE